MLLAVVVAVLCGISNRCIRTVNDNQEYEQAWGILDEHLSNISGRFGDFMERGISDGELPGWYGDQVEDKYYWHVDVKNVDGGGLYEVDVTIRWLGGRGWRKVSGATMLNE